MGGFGSGKGRKYLKSSKRQRPYQEAFYMLDAKKICIPSDGILRFPPEMNWFGISKLEMISHKSPTGGLWYTFRCPRCKSGRFKLLFSKSKTSVISIGCRSCLKIAYRSENRGKTDRADEMKRKLMKQLDEKYDFGELPNRPKGMHKRTYDRLIDRIEKYDKLGWSHFFGRGSIRNPLMKQLFEFHMRY